MNKYVGTLNESDLAKYKKSPAGMDVWLRKKFKIPDDRYYTVSIYPDSVAGKVYIDLTRKRAKSAEKLSKSP